MDKEPFHLSAADSVATMTLGRPDAGNKLLTEEISALGRAIRDVGSRPEIKLVVLRAQGPAFCLGRQPASGAAAPRSALGVREGVTQPILDLYADVRATPVPVLAVVQGEARGFGCALVGQCDLAIASGGALFSMPELETNLPPTLAISAVLGKVPPKRLMHMVYTRRSIGAEEALSMGLVSEVVKAENLDVAAERTISDLVSRRRQSLCAVKEYMNVAPYTDPGAAARLASNILSVVLSSKDED